MASIAVAKNSLSHMVNNLIIVLCIVIPNWRSIYREIGSSAMQQHDLKTGLSELEWGRGEGCMYPTKFSSDQLK